MRCRSSQQGWQSPPGKTPGNSEHYFAISEVCCLLTGALRRHGQLNHPPLMRFELTPIPTAIKIEQRKQGGHVYTRPQMQGPHPTFQLSDMDHAFLHAYHLGQTHHSWTEFPSCIEYAVKLEAESTRASQPRSLPPPNRISWMQASNHPLHKRTITSIL